MRIFYKDSFKKSFQKRFSYNTKVKTALKKRIALFLENPTHELLKIHPLIGSLKGLYAFSVTGDIRVVYYCEGDKIYLVDIGSHNQVY